MAYDFDGKKYSYDYDELIRELLDDLSEGLIRNDTAISILRSESAIRINNNTFYYPIIDYYYPEAYQDGSLTSIYNRDEYTDNEWAELEIEYNDGLRQYLTDKPNLKDCTVSEVLREMRQWNDVV